MSSSEHQTSEQTRSILFDLRTIIGGLFAVYGIVCLIIGIVSFTPADAQKAGGINVNLWSGIGMIIIAAIFLIWSFTRPLEVGELKAEAADNDQPGDSSDLGDANTPG
ncbi:hypothetical protein FOE78_07565 [Microlunatus elymi]|uniref:Uncharacterized protein n=1 Tax=Microlunatus elymi TaxID=2596828 RepID=A0A516PX71_9ACTN|nr:hypothetical protein [Microlunatus elymi]QDP95773.1 hypothetical protein FOE78_07565 [Microlunatus elymi]